MALVPRERGRRRGTTGGDAGTVARRRRAAAQQRLGAGVLRSLRKLHQDDGERPADSSVGFRSGGGEARRRTASNRGGASPASPGTRGETRNRARDASACSSPSRAAPEAIHGGGKAATERNRSGGRRPRV
jgi:hypothetical protein